MEVRLSLTWSSFAISMTRDVEVVDYESSSCWSWCVEIWPGRRSAQCRKLFFGTWRGGCGIEYEPGSGEGGLRMEDEG